MVSPPTNDEVTELHFSIKHCGLTILNTSSHLHALLSTHANNQYPTLRQLSLVFLFSFGLMVTSHGMAQSSTSDSETADDSAQVFWTVAKSVTKNLGLSNFNYSLSFITLADRITSVQDSSLNPDNHSAVPKLVLDNSLILNFETEKVIGRAKFIDRTFTGGDFSGRIEENDIRLQNIYYSLFPFEGVDLTIGKRSLPFDNGYASTPLNFFTNTSGGNDLTDRYSDAEGVPLIAATYYYGKYATTVAYGDDFENDDKLGITNFGRRQTMVQQFIDLGNYQTGLVAQKFSDSEIAIGGTVSAVFGLGLELHASVLGREGSDRFYSLANVDPTASPFDLTRSNHLRNSSHYFVQSVIGANYTTASFVNIVAEWIHDERGLSTSQWDRYIDNIATYRALLPTDPATANALLSASSATLSAQGARRDYLYFRVAKTIEDWSLDGGIQIGLIDGDSLSTLRLTYTGEKSTAVDFSLRIAEGPSDSEYGLLAEKIRAGIGIRYNF